MFAELPNHSPLLTMVEAISKALIEDQAHAFMGQPRKTVARRVSYMFYQYRNNPKHSLKPTLGLIRPKQEFLGF